MVDRLACDGHSVLYLVSSRRCPASGHYWRQSSRGFVACVGSRRPVASVRAAPPNTALQADERRATNSTYQKVTLAPLAAERQNRWADLHITEREL